VSFINGLRPFHRRYALDAILAQSGTLRSPAKADAQSDRREAVFPWVPLWNDHDVHLVADLFYLFYQVEIR